MSREAEATIAQQNSKPIFVNKQSERLLQRAADSGREVRGIDAGSKTPRSQPAVDSGQRFDSEFGTSTPRHSTSRSHSRAHSPQPNTPRTPRSSLARTTPAREQRVPSTASKSPPGSPDSTPGRRSDTGAIPRFSTGRGRGGMANTNQDGTICAADPNSIGEGASDIKWLAHMASKTGVEPRPSRARSSSRSTASSPPPARAGASSGFNPFAEMDKMRMEFQKLMIEKEVSSPPPPLPNHCDASIPR